VRAALHPETDESTTMANRVLVRGARCGRGVVAALAGRRAGRVPAPAASV
jgi:hypothetical protein